MTRRAYDEKVIRERGPLGAVMAAKTEDVAVRRASLVLGLHRDGHARIHPDKVRAALATWELLNRRAS